jgi:serine/threonine-protein kinase
MGAANLGTDPTLVADDDGTSATGSGQVVAPTVVAGRYEILGLLGTGGMGRVYRALDRELGEAVALKVLHRDFVRSAEMVERFRQEVRLARKVTHRNVARTYDIGEHEGEKFLTMELIDGEPLSTRLQRGLLTIPETVAVAREIALGMSAAHAVGVVHRDLKPDNVLLERSGRVVVTDFGIARRESRDESSKTMGRAVGTPAYMAPEQVSGSTDVDARADIYAFGAILFEMLTGHHAWPGDSALAVAAARLVEPPPDPRKHRPGLSKSLCDVVLRCLARDRESRFANDGDLDRALAAADVSDETAAPARARQTVPPPMADARERTVAVVPFRNFGPPDDAYFVEGLVEDLVDTLATVRGLRVRGRGYAEAADRDVVETGRRLGVDVVVDGSVRRSGDTLRVSARVVGVADGFQLWSSRFERPAGGAFALNDEVARAIASALAAKVEEAPRAQTADPVAIDLYFRAKHAVGRFWAAEGMADAISLFKEALARAPNDVTILAGYVHAQIGRNFFAPLATEEATSFVRRALTAAPRLPEPWVALAALRFNHKDDPAGAVRALHHAVDLAPSSSEAHDLTGRILLEADAMDDAIAHLERALWLDPSQRWSRIDRMRAAALCGDWHKAREVFDTAGDPGWIGHRMVHQARLWSWPDAPMIEIAVLPENVDPRFVDIVKTFEMFHRDRRAGTRTRPVDEVRTPMEALMTRASSQKRARRFFFQLMTEQLMLYAHHDAALDAIESAVNEGLIDLSWMRRLRLLDPVRENPRFTAALAVVRSRAERVVAAWRGPVESHEEALASLG